MIRAFCIDDTNKPAEIPKSHWIKKGRKYKIIHVSRMVKQSNILGVDLSEVSLVDLENCPYNCYKLTRFAIKLEDFDKFVELMKSCEELNDFDFSEVDKILEEQLVLL